jgi:uncharacterized membrane protein YeaQ/YmgE (transglycosylase-associated protein family)
MGIMAWIIVGIIAGWMAKRVIPGEGPAGLLGDLVIGVVGAIVGGWVFNSFGHPGATGVNIGSIIVSFVGAVVVLWLIRQLTGMRHSRLA